MKPMYLLILVILLGVGFTPNVTATNLLTYSNNIAPSRDECDEIKKAKNTAKKAISAIKNSKGKGKPSPLDAAKTAYDAAKEALAKYDEGTEEAQRTNSTEHEASRKQEELKKQLADARIAYADLLGQLQALYGTLAAELKKYQDKCEKDFVNLGGKKVLKRAEKNRDEYADQENKLFDEAVADALKELHIDPARKQGESDDDYEDRLEKEKEKLPWTTPIIGEDESGSDFTKKRKEWERKFKETKWADGFWKKVADAIDKRLKEAKDSFTMGNVPGDQGALPDRPDRKNNRFLRLAAEIERSSAAFYSPSTVADVEQFLYADPEQYINWVEALEGEFALGDLSGTTNLTFTHPQATYRYGVVGGINILPQLEANFRLQYGRSTHSSAIPMLLFSFDGTQNELPASWTAKRQSLRVNTSIDYRIGNGAWQLLAGPRIGLEQRSGTNALSAGTQYAEQSLEKDHQPFYGLGLGIRRQMGDLYSEVRTNWETQDGKHHFTLGLRIGLSR